MPRMSGKRAMVEQLIADGTRHIFGNPGTTEQGFMDILQEYPQLQFMLNNAAYRILKLNMVEYLGQAARGRQFVAMDLTDPELRFDRMADAMGVPGRRIENPDELAPALKEALAHDGPSLIDVVMESPVP